MGTSKTQRASKTRDALISAGFDLTMHRSVDAIPIDDLVAAAGVGKGSFFNHFGDKEGFKLAIANQLRAEVEAQISSANSDVANPLERLAGGLRELTNYTLIHRTRAVAMVRMTVGATATDYALNAGMRADIEACVNAKLLREEAREDGVLYWLGLSVAIITHVVEDNLSRSEAAEKLRAMLFLGLRGLGATEKRARDTAALSAERLKQINDVER
ncbi:MAG: TetR/AcrR family transcriptional regulator [Pseudomonadota bacterium]